MIGILVEDDLAVGRPSKELLDPAVFDKRILPGAEQEQGNTNLVGAQSCSSRVFEALVDPPVRAVSL